MDRKTLRYVFVALLGGVAMALAAATFPTSRPDPADTGNGDAGDGTWSLPLLEDAPAPVTESDPLWNEVLGVIVVVLALATLVYCVLYWREALYRVLEGLVVAGFMFLLFQLVMRFFSADFDEREVAVGTDSSLGPAGDGGETAVSTDPSSLAVLLVVVVGLVLVGLAVVLTRQSEDDDDEQGAEDPEPTAAVGRAAGRAADRLEASEDTDNEIYRAWAEMAGLVGLDDPDTRTPAEFADAAVEAGMDPSDVRELTRLFEQVRYGTDEPTPADEQRAVTLLRRIESTYAEEP